MITSRIPLPGEMYVYNDEVFVVLHIESKYRDEYSGTFLIITELTCEKANGACVSDHFKFAIV